MENITNPNSDAQVTNSQTLCDSFYEEAMKHSDGKFPMEYLKSLLHRLATKDLELIQREQVIFEREQVLKKQLGDDVRGFKRGNRGNRTRGQRGRGYRGKSLTNNAEKDSN